MRKLLRPLYRALFSERSRARLRPLAYPLDSLFRALVWRSTLGRGCAGPFTGLALASNAPLPHLLGTYERELHDVIESLCGRPWQRIVNVGGGNGFYAAGLGRRIADAELVVFELDAEARDVIAETIARNGLAARTRILGVADPVGLEAACAGASPTLVVMDVEGAELELADPALVPSLRRATIVVETHDVIRPGCRDTVAARFAGTHTLIAIATRARTLDDFPASVSPRLRRFAPARCLGAVQEWREGAQEWLILEPHR
jgi:hypothetical protein